MQHGDRLNDGEFWRRERETEQQVRGTKFLIDAWQLVEWRGLSMIGAVQFDGSVFGVVHMLDASERATSPRISVVRTDAPSSEHLVLPWLSGASDVSSAMPVPDGDLSLETPVGALTASVWRHGPREWFAAADLLDSTSVTLHSEGVPMSAFTLVAVEDFEPLLAAHREWISALRGNDTDD